MDIVGGFNRLLGLGPKDVQTPEQRVAQLKQKAEEAEKLAEQTKEAVGYRKRIATAEFERRKALNESGGTKKGLTGTQLLVFGVLALVFVVLLFKAC